MRHKILTAIIFSFVAVGMYAQVKHIKPKNVAKLQTISAEQYNQLGEAYNTGKMTEKEVKKFENDALFYDFFSGGCSWYCGGDVDTIVASSCLEQDGRKYAGANVHDFDVTTQWIEGATGQGIGEYLEYTFPGSCPRITTINIINGDITDLVTWKNRSRVKQLKVYFNGAPYAILDLKDSRSLQTFEIGTIGFHDAYMPQWTLRFEILDVYPGDKLEETAISELIFDGVDVH